VIRRIVIWKQSASRVVAKARFVFGLNPPARNVKVYTDDVWLTSYPRSGNTWARFMIANLLRPNVAHTLHSVQRLVPDIYAVSERSLAVVARPRILKSHEYFDPRYRCIIYLVRDPRDVAVSYFHFQTQRELIAAELPARKWIGDFIAGGGEFGSWRDHVESWLSTRGDSERFALVRYEDVKEDPVRELKRISRFLEKSLPLDPQGVKLAVERSSIEELRQLEQRSPGAQPIVRRGVVGGWRNELPREAAAAIEDAFGDTMRKLNYLP